MTTNSIDALWYTRCSVPTALGLASQLGWLDRTFGEDGIAIRSVQDSSDPDVRASHFDHRLRYSVRQGGSIPAIWARARGVETRVVGLTWTEEAQTILALPDAGIRSVADLRGKRIGIPRHIGQAIEITGVGALRGVLSALATEGLTEKDVKLVDLAIPEEQWKVRLDPSSPRQGRNEFWPDAHALIRGEVDAIFVKGSRGREVEGFLGAHVVYDLASHPDWKVRVNNGVPRPLTVDTALLENHPQVVKKIVSLVRKTSGWAREHAAETVRAVSREVFSIEPSVKAAYPKVHEQLDTTLDEWLVEGLQQYTTFLARHKFIEREFDVRTWIDPRPLAEARADEVSTHNGNSTQASSHAE
jgi:ABC-type nitrate/sulfonate/bicarbonate transport system substrate-binding protein